MAITRQKKEEILQELIDKFGKSKSVVFADYRGLDVASISDLRSKLREGDAEMKIAKKTLIGLAVKDQKIDGLDDSMMEGPVAVTFSYEDALSGIQILYKFSKSNDNLKLLGGIMDGKVIGSDEVKKYAVLPSREELLAKFIGSMNSPVSGFVGTLSNVLSGFVRVLQSYKDTLPASAEVMADKPVEETPVSEKAEAETTSEDVVETQSDSAETPVSTDDDRPAETDVLPAEAEPVEGEKSDTPAEGTENEDKGEEKSE